MRLTIRGTLKSTTVATSTHKDEQSCTSTREDTHVLDAVLSSDEKPADTTATADTE